MRSTRVSCTHDCIQRDQVDCEGATHVSRSTPTALVAIALSSECSGDAVCVCVRGLELCYVNPIWPAQVLCLVCADTNTLHLRPSRVANNTASKTNAVGAAGAHVYRLHHTTRASVCGGSQVSLTSAHFDRLSFMLFIDFLL